MVDTTAPSDRLPTDLAVTPEALVPLKQNQDDISVKGMPTVAWSSRHC